jgi:hypothetical protein
VPAHWYMRKLFCFVREAGVQLYDKRQGQPCIDGSPQRSAVRLAGRDWSGGGSAGPWLYLERR